MSRIQVNLESKSLKKLDDIAAELTKGDETLRQPRKREMAIEYLIEAVTKAHEVVISQKNQIHAITSQLQVANEGRKSDSERLEESIEALKEKKASLSYQLHCKDDKIKCFIRAINYLSESRDG